MPTASFLQAFIPRLSPKSVSAFGTTSEIRRAEMESIGWLVDLAAPRPLWRIILNGSFVTNIIEPNDVDCMLLIAPGASKDSAAEDELPQGLPFLDIAPVGQKDFDYFVDRFLRGRIGCCERKA